MKSTIYLSDNSSVIVTEDLAALTSAFNSAQMVQVTLAEGGQKIVLNRDSIVKIEQYTE